MRLEGQSIIVTGVTSGVGRALAFTLASLGAAVTGIARRSELGESLAQEIAAAGGDFLFIAGDVSNAAGCTAATRLCQERRGRIDVLINNAGIIGAPGLGPLDETTEDTWDGVHSVNLRGAFLMSRAVLPAMRKQRDGLTIMIASQCAVWGLEGLGAYNASKAGLVGLSNTIAVEGWRDGIRCNAILLGGVRTEAGRSAGQAVRKLGEASAARVRSKPLDGDAVAKSIAVLCLPEARMITGAAIPIDQAFIAGRAMSRLLRAMNGVELD